MSGYKVTGAAAVVELDDGNEELGTGKRVYLDHGVQVPAEAKKAHVEHLLNVGLIEETDSAPEPEAEPVDEPEGEQSEPVAEEAPAKSGRK